MQTFDLCVLRFHLHDAREVANGGLGNFLRGRFGAILKRSAPEAYDRYFAPVAGGGPSGLQQPPRPFVFRLTDPASINVFDLTAVPIFENALVQFPATVESVE